MAYRIVMLKSLTTKVSGKKERLKDGLGLVKLNSKLLIFPPTPTNFLG